MVNVTMQATQLRIKCAVLNIIKQDGRNPWNKATECNKVLVKETRLTLIDNSNITLNHLNGSGLHLSKRGAAAVANNFIQYIRNLSRHYCGGKF